MVSSIDSETALAKVKQLFEDQRLDEVYPEVQKGLQLDPNNIKYHIWLARYYSMRAMETEEPSIFQKSIEAANQALRLDSTSSVAYMELAGAYMFSGNIKQAINNLNTAIKYGGSNKRAYQMFGLISYQNEDAQAAVDYFTKALESPVDDEFSLVKSVEMTNADLLLFRSHNYELIGDYKHAIEDRINAYQFTKKSWPEIDPKFQQWADGAYKHFSEKLLPKIKSSGEKFLDYWECYWSSGGDALRSDRGNTGLVGTFGTGYVCLTDKNIHLVSLGELTRKFSPIKKKGGWRNFVELYVFGHSSLYDLREVEKTDKIWQIPFPSVQGAQIVDNYIELIAPPGKWTFSPGESGRIQMMMAAIHMGYSGELAKMWEDPNANAKYTINVARDLNMKKDEIKVRLGDNATIIGDIITAGRIENSFNKAKDSNVPNELKTLLEDFSIAVGKMTEKMSKEEARRVAQDLEMLTTEATSPSPQQKRWKFSLEELKEAAKNVGEIGKPVLDIAVRIAAVLSGIV